MKFPYIFLLIILPALLLTGCNDDIFVDKEDLAIRVSNSKMDWRGDKSTVIFSDVERETVPEIHVWTVSSDNTFLSFDPFKVNGNKKFDNTMLSFTAEYTADRRQLTINLDYSLYTDTVYIEADRYSGSLTQNATIKITPAAKSEIRNFRYENDGYSMSVEEVNGLKKLNVVNKGYGPVTYSVLPSSLTAYKFEPFNYYFLPDILGEPAPMLPAAIVDKDGVKVLDIDVPFSKQQGIISGYEPEGLEPYTLTLPARSLCQITVYTTLREYAVRYNMDIVNTGIPDLELKERGEFKIAKPESYTVMAKAFDLEEGTEIPL